MASSRFWHNLAENFRSIYDPDNELSAEWWQMRTEPKEISWQIHGAASSEASAHFIDLAKIGGKQLDSKSTEPLSVWLNKLREIRPSHNKRVQLVVATAKTGTVFDSGTVRAVREASANLCALLEMEAQAKEDSARPSRKGKPTMENKEPTITRERIDAFIARVLSDTSKKINRTDFWLVAGYENRSEFERFQRDDPKTTKSAKRRFEEVLALDSTLFLERLKKTRS